MATGPVPEVAVAITAAYTISEWAAREKVGPASSRRHDLPARGPETISVLNMALLHVGVAKSLDPSIGSAAGGCLSDGLVWDYKAMTPQLRYPAPRNLLVTGAALSSTSLPSVSCRLGANPNPVVPLPTTPKLPLKLHERLGDEAMTELLTLFGDLGAESRAAFQDVRDAVNRLEKGLRDVKQDIADLRQDLNKQIADVKQDLNRQITDLKPQIASVQGELIKWTFLFWLGTIGIVLLLIRFPR